MRARFACVVLVLGATASGLGACSSGEASSAEAGTDGSTDSTADSTSNDASTDAGADSKADAASTVPALKIVTTNGAPLQGGPGDALNLQVLFVLADGGTVAASEQITWTAPETVTAQNPNDAGPNGILPEAGTRPIAFFVLNNYGDNNFGALYIVDPGSASDAGVTVTASVSDAGQVSALVAISPALAGDAGRGRNLFLNVLPCATCHGTSAAGSPPVDGGEAGILYANPINGGDLYTYPAPGLNDAITDAGPNLAADPAWSAGLLGMAIQADMDNEGVALRAPMPNFFQATTNDAGTTTLNAQDVADIYAWLKTQH